MSYCNSEDVLWYPLKMQSTAASRRERLARLKALRDEQMDTGAHLRMHSCCRAAQLLRQLLALLSMQQKCHRFCACICTCLHCPI